MTPLPLVLAAGGNLPTLQIDPWVGLGLALLLVVLNGFFVAAEFALAKVRPTQIEPYALRGERRGKVAANMVSHLDAYLSATQLGITLASIALGWVGEPAFAWIVEPLVSRIPGAGPALVHSVALTASFVAVSILHIVFGELVPKSIAIRLPAGTTLWTALPLYLFYWIAFPAIWLLNHTANGILRLVGIRPASEHEIAHSEEEIRLLLASQHGSQISDAKRDLLANVFELSDRVARQVMLPRADVVYLSTERSLDENLALARRSGHTRFPLCAGDLDRIVGVVHIKDLFRAETPVTDLTKIARPVKFVPESTALDRLLARMRSENLHLAAVLDEYGGVSGIVTLENVIEEIVGPIQDEFGAEKPELVDKGGGVYQISGAMLVVDLEDELGLELSDRDEDTVAGVVLSELGRRPRAGDRAELAGVRFEVLEVLGNRIKSLRLTLPPTTAS
ncbi:MAG: hemolysin family protein [Thermoanaerobaculia bacterium]|nr:hemolysin family protein [Thermoanaerobaculia bacterium]